MSNVAKDRCIVKLTSNFKRDLRGIEDFLDANEASDGFDALLEELTATAIPNLRLFPAMGRPLLDVPARSVEAVQAVSRLRGRAAPVLEHGSVREYLMTDYVMLYAFMDGEVQLLHIRHHKELSFDFAGHWIGR